MLDDDDHEVVVRHVEGKVQEGGNPGAVARVANGTRVTCMLGEAVPMLKPLLRACVIQAVLR